MPQTSQYPLWGINRAFVAFEALELARRADRRETHRSRSTDLPASRPKPQQCRTPLRRVGLALVVAVIGVATAGWIA